MTFLLDILPEIFLVLDYSLRVVFATRIIMRRMQTGASLAWLAVVMAFPFAGVFVYLLVGELRIGNRRANWASRIHEPFERWLHSLKKRLLVDWSRHSDACLSLSRLAEVGVGIPALPGNSLELMEHADEIFARMVEDIDAAERTCHLEFYIWTEGGNTDQVVEAIIRAQQRGVICRILLDAVGSRPFLRSRTAKRLRSHGVQLYAALPASIIRMLFVRFDLRLHRKIAVIDGEIAYTGSLNLADPRFFRQWVGVGEWVDAMVRITGPAVEGLAITFLEDWELETCEGVEKLSHTGDVHVLEPVGESTVHVVPSGPAIRRDAIDRLLISAIYEARRTIIITTPYFVPTESLQIALVSAARRGVDVTLILPLRVDSKLVRLASESHQDELLDANVKIQLYDGGLLHTKSVTIDDDISLFGSLNLDPRSLHLNFEITLLVHCAAFHEKLRDLQMRYLKDSVTLSIEQIRNRSLPVRLARNVVRLLGPLL